MRIRKLIPTIIAASLAIGACGTGKDKAKDLLPIQNLEYEINKSEVPVIQNNTPHGETPIGPLDVYEIRLGDDKYNLTEWTGHAWETYLNTGADLGWSKENPMPENLWTATIIPELEKTKKTDNGYEALAENLRSWKGTPTYELLVEKDLPPSGIQKLDLTQVKITKEKTLQDIVDNPEEFTAKELMQGKELGNILYFSLDPTFEGKGNDGHNSVAAGSYLDALENAMGQVRIYNKNLSQNPEFQGTKPYINLVTIAPVGEPKWKTGENGKQGIYQEWQALGMRTNHDE